MTGQQVQMEDANTDVRSQWFVSARELLEAGWNDAEVRGTLVRLGCPRELAPQFLAEVKRQLRAVERRVGLVLLVLGVLLFALSMLFVDWGPYAAHVRPSRIARILLLLGGSCLAGGFWKLLFGR